MGCAELGGGKTRCGPGQEGELGCSLRESEEEKKGEKEGDSAQEDRKEFSILIKHTGMKTKRVWRKIQLRLEMNSERGFKKSLKRSPRS